MHDNLAIYFVHGASQSGAVPLTLAEALSRHLVEVRETGDGERAADREPERQPIFVQAGDIVKGGRQDRTLAVSLLLPPKSGRVPIASFCVEHGRWSQRAGEDSHAFASAAASVPSREMKLAMQAPLSAVSPAAPVDEPRNAGSPPACGREKSGKACARCRTVSAASMGADVRARASESSLQLALENKKLEALRAAYIGALENAGENDADIVGYFIAVNGKLNSGDVYLSNGLFRKMWPKMLAAAANDAIGRRHDANGAPPDVAAVQEFMAAAKAGQASEKDLVFGLHRVMHAGDKAYLIEVALKDGFVHRSYLAK